MRYRRGKLPGREEYKLFICFTLDKQGWYLRLGWKTTWAMCLAPAARGHNVERIANCLTSL